MLRLPYYESMAVGTGTTPALIAQYRYTYYSSPVSDLVELWGFSVNFSSASGIVIQLADINEAGTWVPFYTTNIYAVAGVLAQIEPVLYLPEPYFMPANHQIQVLLQNNGVANVGSAILTFVGVRVRPEREGEILTPCSN